MTRIDGLSRSQRIVVVIGLGVALYFAGGYVTSLGRPTGWFAYAPLSTATFAPPGRLSPLLQFVVWLILVVMWVAGSLLILREPAQPAAGARTPAQAGDTSGTGAGSRSA
jgi:heme/copper-type cytochrome/quinol oxidase subunit 1